MANYREKDYDMKHPFNSCMHSSKWNNFIGSHVGSSSVFIAIFATEMHWKDPAGWSYLALI